MLLPCNCFTVHVFLSTKLAYLSKFSESRLSRPIKMPEQDQFHPRRWSKKAKAGWQLWQCKMLWLHVCSKAGRYSLCSLYSLYSYRKRPFKMGFPLPSNRAGTFFISSHLDLSPTQGLPRGMMTKNPLLDITSDSWSYPRPP